MLDLTRRSFLVAVAVVGDRAGLTKAMARAKPGDTVTLKNGIYDDLEIVMENEGTPDKQILLRAETGGQVVLRGKSRARLSGKHLVLEGIDFRGCQEGTPIVEFRSSPQQEAEDCRVTDCAFRNGVAGEAGKTAHWVSLYGARNQVDRNYLAGKKTLGPTMVVWVDPRRVNGHRIERNYFGHRPTLGENGGETLRVGVSQVSMSNSQTLVEENYFEECDGEIEVISNKSCENVYRGNTFRRCDGTLTLRHGNRCLVEANVFAGEGKAGSGGVRIIGEDHRVLRNWFIGLQGSGARAAVSMMRGIPDSPLNGYFQVKWGTVQGNRIFGCKEAFALGVGTRKEATLAPMDCVVEDNDVREVLLAWTGEWPVIGRKKGVGPSWWTGSGR